MHHQKPISFCGIVLKMRAYPKLLKLLITNAQAKKSVIYGIIETRFFEGKKGKFDVGLNCTDRF